MNPAVDYGTPAPKVERKPVMDGRQRVEVITNVTIGIVIMVVVALIISPFVYYVASVVPDQQQQWHDLRVTCLEHHTVEACMNIGGKAATT
jgi:hypothetical protein